MARSTSQYYKDNEPARRRRLIQQGKYNKTKKGLRIRVAANAANHAKGTYGNGDNRDVAHKKGHEGGKKASDVTLTKPSINRKSRLKIRKA